MSIIKKTATGLTSLVAVLTVASAIALKQLGAWNIVFPSHAHETVPPELPTDITSPAILLFTKTNSFRHIEGIEAGSQFFEQLAQKHGWSLVHTENSAAFNERDLSKFQTVVFHNASGDTLSQAQQQVFQNWLTKGGGWLGVHAAGDSSHTDWPWYMENLIGVLFTAHIMGPQFQEAKVINEDPSHPAMQHLPKQWLHTEEWYSWEESARTKGFYILASIDENSYSPVQHFMGASNDLRMGDHPVVWSNCVGKGRAIYSALGHSAEAYQAEAHQQLLENALIWTLNRQACSAQ